MAAHILNWSGEKIEVANLAKGCLDARVAPFFDLRAWNEAGFADSGSSSIREPPDQIRVGARQLPVTWRCVNQIAMRF